MENVLCSTYVNSFPGYVRQKKIRMVAICLFAFIVNNALFAKSNKSVMHTLPSILMIFVAVQILKALCVIALIFKVTVRSKSFSPNIFLNFLEKNRYNYFNHLPNCRVHNNQNRKSSCQLVKFQNSSAKQNLESFKHGLLKIDKVFYTSRKIIHKVKKIIGTVYCSDLSPSYTTVK